MNDKRLTRAQERGEAPLPHPLTPEANVESKPGEISDQDNSYDTASELTDAAYDKNVSAPKKGNK